MENMNSTKNYAIITGGLLFLLGLFGFAFREHFNLADKYLLLALLVGFWGVVLGFHEKKA